MHRIVRILLAAALTLAASAQPAASVKLRIRAVLHDPLKPFAAMYVPGTTDALIRLNLALEGLTDPQLVTLPMGVLQFFATPTRDPANPQANLLASVQVPAGVTQAIILILPAGDKAKLPYKLMILNDGLAAFGMGESRVINLTALPLAIKAGEHNKEIPPATVVAVPPVTKVNDLNQAQTLFYRKTDTEWVLLAERPMQFTATLRNIFLMYLMPNVEEPQIRTLIDTSTPR